MLFSEHALHSGMSKKKAILNLTEKTFIEYLLSDAVYIPKHRVKDFSLFPLYVGLIIHEIHMYNVM